MRLSTPQAIPFGLLAVVVSLVQFCRTEPIEVLERYRIDGNLSDESSWFVIPQLESTVEDAEDIAMSPTWLAGLRDCIRVVYRQAIIDLNNKHHLRVSRVLINSQPDESSVNIFIVNSDPKGVLNTFGVCDNFGYVGFGNVIVCDAKAVDRILFKTPDRMIDKADHRGAFATLSDWYSRRILLLFILLHEMGHAGYMHSADIYSDNAAALKAEEAADQFALNVINEVGARGDAAGLSPGMLANALDDYLDRLCQTNRIGTLRDLLASQCRVSIRTASRSHPPLFKRFVSLSAELFRLDGDELGPIVSYRARYAGLLNRLDIEYVPDLNVDEVCVSAP